MKQLIGKQFGGRYVTQLLLGKQRGRRTFLAEDVQTNQLVVIKLILFSPDFTWQDLKLFEREAETLKALNHDAIPKYVDYFEVELEGGKGFALVQTYIDAKSLGEWVTSGRTFSEGDLKAIARALLDILQYLHNRHPPIIHRDIKPSNILLAAGRSAHSPGKLYLVDFGSVQTIATAGTMTVVGTYGYMPPEQFGGRALPASDLYSLGATLIYLSSGKHPSDFEYGELHQALSSLTLSKPFANWIEQLTYIQVSKRTASAAIALKQLEDPPASSTNIEPLQKSVAMQRLQTHTDKLTPELKDLSVKSDFEEIEFWLKGDRTALDTRPTSYITLLNILLVFSPVLPFLIAWVIRGPAALLIALYVIFTLIFLRFYGRAKIPLSKDGLVSLKLWSPTEDSLRLTLSALPSHIDQPVFSGRIVRKQHTRIAYQSVQSIKIKTTYGKNEKTLSFLLAQNTDKESSYLQVKGTYAEIQWLCNHLAQWKDVPIYIES